MLNIGKQKSLKKLQKSMFLSNKDIKNMEKLIELLEDKDDVQKVYHNWEQG